MSREAARDRRFPVSAYVGIGSNLGRPVSRVRAAVTALDALDGCRVVACSRLYRNPPLGPAQPDYVNAVVRLDSGYGAEDLLRRLQAIEAAAGRDRAGEQRWGPRTLDLDLLLYGDERIESPDLSVPHPRLHQRPFVVYPLREIAPDLEVPGQGAVAELARRLTPDALVAVGGDEEG